MANSSKNWFVVQTLPRKESIARLNLERQGYKILLPILHHRKRSRGKWQDVLEPMFPGYLFIELTMGRDNMAPIRSTVGCKRIVKFGLDPQIVPAEVITPLLALGDEPVEIKKQLKSGDRIHFETGPLKGLDGIFNLVKGSERAEVLIGLLGRRTNVVADLNEISKSK